MLSGNAVGGTWPSLLSASQQLSCTISHSLACLALLAAKTAPIPEKFAVIYLATPYNHCVAAGAIPKGSMVTGSKANSLASTRKSHNVELLCTGKPANPLHVIGT